MSDLVKRLRDHDVPLMSQPGKFADTRKAIRAAADLIEVQAAQIAAADRLAELVGQEDMTDRMLANGVSNEIKSRDWAQIRAALAAYRAAREARV